MISRNIQMEFNHILEEKQELSKLSKQELLERCAILGCAKYKSKNKKELIDLIEKEIERKDIETDTKDITLFEEQSNEDEKVIINENISYYNMDALKFETSIRFDLIYIDPPYDTNRTFTINSLDDETGFQDIWEEDKYEEWLNTFIQHLSPMLSQNGTLVFHISGENSFVVESVLRRYFAKIQKIYWKRCHGKNAVKNKLGEMMDILFACSHHQNIFHMIYLPIDDKSEWAFKNEDENGKYSLGALKHDRTRSGYMYSIEKDGVIYENKYGWKQKQEVVEKWIEQNRIHFVPKQKNMYVKIYKHEHKGVPLSNLWTDIHSITRTSKDPRLYPTQKPQKLLERIIQLYTNEDSYILDPVCGSGTTGFVADKLKRKCVLCDINPDTLSILQKRFQDGIYNIE